MNHCVALSIVVAFAGILQAEPTPPALIDPQSSHVFRALLRNRGIEPTHPGEFGSDWSETILIIFGPISDAHQSHLRQMISAVISRGGALLIASDGNHEFGDFLASPLGTLEIDGKVLEDAGHCYEGMVDLPFLRFRNTILEIDLKQISMLKAVATNRPSFLLNYQPRLQPFGEFSELSKVGGLPPASRVGMAVMSPERGTCVVISDAGVLANQMLVPQGVMKLDNYEFAYHLVSYLVNGPNRTRKRTRCIFIEDGKYVQNFDGVQLSPGPPDFRPPWAAIQKTLAENTENKINELQDRDFPTRDFLRKAGYLSTVQKLFAAAAVVAILAMLRRVWNGRVTKVNTQGNPTALAAAERSDKLSLASREKLLRYFSAWGVDHQPRLAVQGSWFYRMRMEKLLNPLIDIAFGSNERPVNRQIWQSLDATIAEVDREVRRGTVQFAEPGS